MKSKITTLLLLLLLGRGLSGQGQNLIPVLSNISLVADTSNHQVNVIYDLQDFENDPCEVWLQVSADGGQTWRVAIDSVSGDAGYPITNGNGHVLTWHYRPATLSAYTVGVTAFSLRLVADDQQPMDLQAVTDLVDSTRLSADLHALEGVRHRTAGLPKLEATKDSLEALMASHALHPYRHGNPFGAYTCENLIGRRSGTRRDSACWQISGHFDTVNNAPGGDDNATAVACVSEAIRVLNGFNTKESIRFFYFDLEEAGLIGSSQYVSGGIPAWESPMGLLNMDCVGFFSNDVNSQVMPSGFNILFPAAYAAVQADSFRGNFLTSVANTPSVWLDSVFHETAAAHVPALKVLSLITPNNGMLTLDLRRSDHAPFWDAGVPALFFSDGANFRNPNYHTPNDTVGTIDMGFYVNNVRAIVTTLARLAQLEHSMVLEAGTLNVDVPVGISQVPSQVLQPKLAILPNPSDGHLQFEIDLPTAGNARLEIRDHHGRLQYVVQDQWTEHGATKIQWHGALASGQYAAVLVTPYGQAYHPVIIQR